jgi:peptide/nickel transport system substrate-binding protein
VDDERVLEARKKVLERVLNRRLSRREFMQMLTAGTAASILAACAPTVAPSPTETSAPVSTPAAGASPTAEAQEATPTSVLAQGTGILINGETQDIATIDPSDRLDYAVEAAFLALYDRLWYRAGWPPQLGPQLCVGYEASDDAREWTLHLTDKAVFHDGTPLTAEAVQFSYNRTLRLQNPISAVMSTLMDLDSVQVEDPQTLKIVLTQPFAELPWILNDQYVMNPKLVMDSAVGDDEGAAWLIDHEAGSGPFTIKRWEPGTLYEFEAVPDYWRGWPGEKRLDGFIWKINREAASRRMQLLTGELQSASLIAIDDIPVINDNPGTHVEVSPSYMAGYFKLNCQREPFNDVNFRKFVSYAFDYDSVVQLRGGAEYGPLLVGPLPDGVPGHDPDVEPVYRQDLQKAREYLDMTAWKDGGLRELTSFYGEVGGFLEQVCLVLQASLAEFDIQLKLVPTLWPDRVAACATPESAYDISGLFVDEGPVTTRWFRYQWYSPTWDRPEGASWQACSFYKNPEVDSLVEEAEVTVDPDQRAEMLKELQHLVMEDAPDIMLFNLPNFIGLSDRVKGYEPTGYSSLEFYQVWLEES